MWNNSSNRAAAGMAVVVAILGGISLEAQAAICEARKSGQIIASYQLAFGRDPDTQEGLGHGELAYWCNQRSFTTGKLLEMHARYMQGSSTAAYETRRNTILRSYGYALGRTGTVGLGAFDVQSCELNYWLNYMTAHPATYKDLTRWHSSWASDLGYYCPYQGDVYGGYGYWKCSQPVPFNGGC